MSKTQRVNCVLKTVLLFLSCNCICYSQGNYRIENYGNRSILLNGNVTGSVEDLGLAYYNPSRLGLIDEPAFAISGKAFELTRIGLENAFGDNRNLNSSEFNGIPSMIAGTFTLEFLPNDKFAYSFISRYRSSINLNYDTGILEDDILNSLDGAERFLGRINLDDEIKEEWFGLTWARKINSNFSIGISSFISVYEMRGNGSTLYTAEGVNENVVTYISDLLYKQKTYGLFFKIGASWKISDVELGMNIHLPYINVIDDASFKGEEFLSGLGAPEDFFNFINVEDLKNKRKTALGVSVGAGIPIQKSRIHLNVDWYNGVDKYERITLPNFTAGVDDVSELDFNEELKSVFNFGAGAEIYISPSFSGFLSFSSDFSAYVENTNLFNVINQNEGEINYESDYWHFGLGFDLSLKWGSFLLGSTYSRTNSEFQQPINFPIDPVDEFEEGISDLQLERWRFIVGLEIPLLNEKLKSLKKNIK
ncbi:hypothetical protein [Aquimarina algiphila]|uniref:hypothetical protein n=1 Tax=Aquimarina algiphila TaxID=2047982 RepID=UPI00249184C6|nr:hypothetical protein [Aquimarina algiphila]